MRAPERLGFYSQRLTLAETGATRLFPPTAEQLRRWADQTPGDFVFDIPAWALLCGAAALPSSLWEDLAGEVRPEARDKHRLYAEHLSLDGLAECWRRFREPLDMLDEAGKLGVCILRLPHWAKPGRTSTTLLGQARAALDGLGIAVELAHHGWHEGPQAEDTLALLEDLELAYVCRDEAAHPTHAAPLQAATADVAVLRALGRRPGRWQWPWRYSEDELDGLASTAERLGAGCSSVHIICANAHSDDAIRAALGLRERLSPAPGQLSLFA